MVVSTRNVSRSPVPEDGVGVAGVDFDLPPEFGDEENGMFCMIIWKRPTMTIDSSLTSCFFLSSSSDGYWKRSVGCWKPGGDGDGGL